MSIKRLIKGAMLRVPPVRRYVAAKWALAAALEQAQAERSELLGELQHANSNADKLRAKVNEVTEQAAALSKKMTAECNELRAEVYRLARRSIEHDVKSIAERIRRHPLDQALAQKDIVLTVTAGRSGTRLLSVLLSKVLGVDARHEPEPRATLWVRPTLENPTFGIDWLIREKLPAIAASPNQIYVETSHFLCKGLIEPMFMLGLRPRFIILRRNSREIAQSFFMLNVVPGRNELGHLGLTKPSDANSLPLPNWQDCSDYQLCYWYAKDIERRQTAYLGFFRKNKISHLDAHIDELLQWESFLNVCRFIDPGVTERTLSRALFDEIISTNQNTRDMAHPVERKDRKLPLDMEEQERQVDLACAANDLSTALNLGIQSFEHAEEALK